MKKFKNILKRKRVVFLAFLITMLLFFIAFIKYSPERTFNIFLGSRYAQLHIRDGYDLFWPTSDSTVLYFHNFNYPEVETGGNTNRSHMVGDGIVDHGFYSEIVHSQIQKPGNSFAFKLPSIPSIKMPAISFPKFVPKYITSRILSLTFTRPEGYEASYSSSYDGGVETIEFKRGFRMTIDISKSLSDEYCKTDLSIDNDLHNPFRKVHSLQSVKLAGRYEFIFSGDGDWRKGWIGSLNKVYLADKKVCISIYREMNGDVEKGFDQILETAKFN